MYTIINSKGRITLPAELRADLGIKHGTRLQVVVDSAGRIVITPIRRGFVHDLRGKYKLDFIHLDINKKAG